MFAAAALIPSAPALFPALTGASRGSMSDVEHAVLLVGRRLSACSDRWLIIGSAVPGSTARLDAQTWGSFAGFGVDTHVRLSPGVELDSASRNDSLPVLLGGWLRGEVAENLSADCVLLNADDDAASHRGLGQELVRELATSSDRVGVLFVADGAATLTATAPGAFDPRAADFQSAVDSAIASADWTSLAAIDEHLAGELGVRGLATWRVLAAVASAQPGLRAESVYIGQPLGVGYHVAWCEAASA